jgi:hypothetical protein
VDRDSVGEMITPMVCWCKAKRTWVIDSRMAFACGTEAQYFSRFGKWRVRRSVECVRLQMGLLSEGEKQILRDELQSLSSKGR